MFRDGITLQSVAGTKRLITAAKDIEEILNHHQVSLYAISEQPGTGTLTLVDKGTHQAIPYYACLKDEEVADYVRTNENQS